MRGRRRVGGQQRAFAADAMLPHDLPERYRARHEDRHQVRHRRSRDKDPAGLARKAEHRARPFNDLTLDFNWNVIAAAEIGVQSGRQHFRKHADGGAAAMHPSHEARMDIPGRIGRDEFGKLLIDLAEIGRLARKLGAKPRADLIRNRTPDRAFADRSDIVDHVIEHAMTLRAEFVPVLRIKRLARSGQHRRHAALSRACKARRRSMAANASNTFRIWGTLYGKTSGGSILWTMAVLSASNISSDPFFVSAQSTVK